MIKTFSRQFLWSENGILLLLALFKLLLHLATNIWGGYGYFRDELYYIACSNHPDIGYVDHPPLSIYVLVASRWVMGDSIFALRFLPAVAGAATVFITGLIARELGGGRYAQALAAIASIVSLMNLGVGTVYSMNSYDILLWTLGAYFIVRLLNTGNPKYWLSIGLVVGLGMLNKTGVLWFAFGILAAFLLTPHRSWFKSKWPWLAGLIAIVLFLPYVVWNLVHDFAHLEFVRNAVSGKYSGLSLLTFVSGQVLVQSPITLPLWLSGLFFFLISREGKNVRLLGYIYAAVFLILLINLHSKAEYLSPAYGMIFAGGAVMFELLFSRRSLSWLKPVSVITVLVGGLFLAPLTLPILPVETYIRYADFLAVKPHTSERQELAELPQFYADMFGWESKVAAVAEVFQRLSVEEKSKAAIFADNYGRCGAIDFFGRKYHLPQSIGPHNNYWIWGPREYTGEIVVYLGGELDDHRESFEEVEVAGMVACDYCMPYENDLTIYVCRNLTVPLDELWPRIKHYQ